MMSNNQRFNKFRQVKHYFHTIPLLKLDFITFTNRISKLRGKLDAFVVVVIIVVVVVFSVIVIVFNKYKRNNRNNNSNKISFANFIKIKFYYRSSNLKTHFRN